MSAYLEIVDIAGLVKGAATGEGLGNAFLSHISAVDGIFHVCRCVLCACICVCDGSIASNAKKLVKPICVCVCVRCACVCARVRALSLTPLGSRTSSFSMGPSADAMW